MARERGWKGNVVFGLTARALMLAAALLLVLSYLSMVVNPGKSWHMSLLGTCYLPIALLNLFLLLWAVRRWSSSFLIPLLALLPSLLFFGRYVQFHSGAVPPEAERCIKIVSYNTGNFILGKLPAAANRDSAYAYLERSQADIICLQEVAVDASSDVAASLEAAFPGYHACYFVYTGPSGNYGNVTLSRFPILDKGIFDFEESSNLVVYTDLQIDSVKVRVYNCHLESYGISLSGLAKSLGRDSTLVRQTERKMRQSIARRPQQVDRVMEDIDACPYETVVAGDFNDTPMSYTYYRLMKRHQDTFVEAGKGFGATYSILWPFVRIDYVLCPASFGVVSFRIPRVRYSDHFPIETQVNVR